MEERNRMSMIPKEIPPGLEAYARSPDFTPDDLPPRLQTAHSTKAGTWGLLRVLEGKILYQLESPYEGEQLAAAGECIVIESEVPHHVEFVERGRFFIEFYRRADMI
jgi:hemoglobin